MRLLLAVHAFPPRSTAGVEVYTLRLAQALQQRGHTVQVLTAVHDLSEAPATLRQRRQEGIDVAEVVSVHHRGTLEATYADPALAAAAEVAIATFRPQCVHVQHLLNLSTGLLAAARRHGAKVVSTLHDYWLSCPRDGLRMRSDLSLCTVVDHRVCAACLAESPYLTPPLQRGAAAVARSTRLGRHLHRIHDKAPRLTETVLGLIRRASPRGEDLASAMDVRAERLRATLAHVDLWLAPTSFAAERAAEFGVPRARLRVVPYGAVLGPTRPRPAGPRRRLGFIGTVAPHKGVHVLVDAFRGLDAPEASLDVHGSLTVQPDYASALKRAAGADPRIRFHGPFPEGTQQEILAGLDALVVPSVWWENSPLTALEALAAGVPVVASATGGVPEIIPPGAGALVPPGDVAALRSALADLVSGRLLAEAAPPLPLKTVADGACELEAAYATLRQTV
jgi:glycosyltransferase involved in cell wall biosynthesis